MKRILIVFLILNMMLISKAVEFSNKEENKLPKISVNGFTDLMVNGYNWGRVRIDRPGFQILPYPVIIDSIAHFDSVIKIYNSVTAPLSIIRIIDVNKIGAISAFEFDTTKLICTLNSGESKIIPVKFHPTQPGPHNFTFEYKTFPPTEYVASTLQGIGILGKLETKNVDFGKTVVNDFNNFVSKKVIIRNLSLQEWSYGDSVTITNLKENNIFPDVIQSWNQFTEPFRYDKMTRYINGIPTNLTFPVVLQPGDSLILSFDFVAKDKGLFFGSLSTVSDAESDVTSELTGSDIDYVGVNEMVQNEDIIIYPNPASDKIYVETDNLSVSGNITIQIIDILGQVRYNDNSITTQNNIKQIELANFENGLYFVKIISGNNVIIRKLIIQK
jgi:hypothetical protein